MKNSITLIVFLATSIFFSKDIIAQKFPKLDISPMDASSYPANWKESDKLVKVIYSRPQLRGRPLSKLAPEGAVWRTGANEATEIIFYKDVKFDNQEVKAGTYSLFTIPNKEKWTIILNSKNNIWGSYFYKQEEDLIRAFGTVSKSENYIEAFSIIFEGEDNKATMHLGWANTIISVPIEQLVIPTNKNEQEKKITQENQN